MLIPELISLFLDSRRQGRAASTVKFYTGRLKLFGQRFADRPLSAVTLQDILRYLVDAGEGRSDSTRRHNAVALQVLHQFALDQGFLEKPLFKKLEKPPMGQRDRLPTAEETAALLANAHPAFRTIYTALRQCGARPGELCRATVADLEFKIVTVRESIMSVGPPVPRQARLPVAIVLKKHKTAAKTGKPRRIPVGGKFRSLIEQSLADRTEGPLFLSPARKEWRVENLSRTYTRLRKAAGLPDDLCLYLARHEHGSTICKAKGIHAAKEALGHTSIQTTQRYVHHTTEELCDYQDVVDAATPEPPRETPA